jgi:hypothetical protein
LFADTLHGVCLVFFDRHVNAIVWQFLTDQGKFPFVKRQSEARSKPKRVKKASSGTTIAVHLPADLRDRVDEAAIKSGLSKQDFYRLCLEIGMIFWDEAGSIAFTLHDAGKNPLSLAKVRAICADYGLYLPEEVTALRAAESST